MCAEPDDWERIERLPRKLKIAPRMLDFYESYIVWREGNFFLCLRSFPNGVIRGGRCFFRATSLPWKNVYGYHGHITSVCGATLTRINRAMVASDAGTGSIGPKSRSSAYWTHQLVSL